jgi:8-oxo-dGTP pyrophosphatase MutT (NUDIX family)
MPAPAYPAAHAFPVSVKGVAVQDGKVLLLENERNEWELPGGRLELGEDPPDCVVREIKEETGWQVTAGPLLDCWQYHIREGSDVVIVTYGCHVLSSTSRRAFSRPGRCQSWSCRTAISARLPYGPPA